MSRLLFTAIGVMFFGFVSSVASASGFQCEMKNSDGTKVLLYNHVDPAEGTRTPAILVISEAREGTLLVRKNQEITKHIRANSVQYVVEGGQKLDVDTAILQIGFRDGREVLASGEEVDGQLIAIKGDERDVVNLTCRRYLKHE